MSKGPRRSDESWMSAGNSTDESSDDTNSHTSLAKKLNDNPPPNIKAFETSHYESDAVADYAMGALYLVGALTIITLQKAAIVVWMVGEGAWWYRKPLAVVSAEVMITCGIFYFTLQALRWVGTIIGDVGGTIVELVKQRAGNSPPDFTKVMAQGEDLVAQITASVTQLVQEATADLRSSLPSHA